MVGGGFGRGSDRMGAPGSGTDQGSSSLLDSEGAWLAASAHLLHLRVCLSGCVCVWGLMRQSTVYVDPWQIWHLSHYTTHLHWCTHARTHQNQSVTHSGNSRKRAHRLHTHTQTHRYTHIKTHCSVTDGCVTHTTVLHFQVRCEQRLSEVIWGEGRQNMVLNVERKKKSYWLQPENWRVFATTQHFWFEHQERPLMTKSGEAAHFIRAKSISHECLNLTVKPAEIHLQMTDL